MKTPEEYNEIYFRDDNLDLTDLIREIQTEAYDEGVKSSKASEDLMRNTLDHLLKLQQEIINSPLRFNGVSVERIKNVFKIHGITQDLEF